MNNIVTITERDENISMVCGAGLAIVLYDAIIPQKMVAVGTYFANYLNLAGHWGAVTWRILRNGVPIFPYENILDQIGLQSRPRRIQRLVFRGGDQVLITATDDGTIAQPPVLEVGIAMRWEEFG